MRDLICTVVFGFRVGVRAMQLRHWLDDDFARRFLAEERSWRDVKYADYLRAAQTEKDAEKRLLLKEEALKLSIEAIVLLALAALLSCGKRG